jgi:hypothetical protein
MGSSDTESSNSSCSRMIRSHAHPPRHAMHRRHRAFLHEPSQRSTMGAIELGRCTRRRNVDEIVRSSVIEPDHAVPPRLPIHPADHGRLGARRAVEYCRDAPTIAALAPGSLTRLASRRTSPGRVVRPHGNSLADGTRSVAILNHGALRFGNPPRVTALEGINGRIRTRPAAQSCGDRASRCR